VYTNMDQWIELRHKYTIRASPYVNYRVKPALTGGHYARSGTTVSRLANWCMKKRYVSNQIVLKELKVEEKPVRSLNDFEIKELLKTTGPYPSMKIRVLLALATGLRRGDIDS